MSGILRNGARLVTREACFTPNAINRSLRRIWRHHEVVNGVETVLGFTQAQAYDPNNFLNLATYLGGGTAALDGCECCELDFSLPKTFYAPFNRNRDRGIGSSVDVGGVPLGGAINQTVTRDFEFVGKRLTRFMVRISAVRLVNGGSLTFNSNASVLSVFGGGDYRVNLRILPRNGINLPVDWEFTPASFGGQERLRLETAANAIDGYIRGPGGRNIPYSFAPLVRDLDE